MPARVLPRTFTTILPLPVAQIQAQDIVSSTRVFASVSTDEDIAKWARDDQFIVVRPKTFPPSPPTQAGGGTNCVEIDGVIEVAIWNRLWVDQASQDTEWIQSGTLGMAPLMDAVGAALEQYYPTDANGNYYFIQPMRILPPGWTFPIKRLGGWGWITASYSLVWHLEL